MPQSDGRDLVRALAVLGAALLQIAAGAVGGSGAFGAASVGEVARSYPNPILPGGTAFMIWNAIYLAVLALAVWQLLPGQRGRAVHRRTGWLIAIAGVLNAVWVLLFSGGQVVAAQIVIVLLLGTLAAAWSRAAAEDGDRSRDRPRRWLLLGPLALYTGWVAVAAVVGALTTVAAVTSDEAGTAAGAVALAVTAVAVAWVAATAVALTGFAVSVLWALTWIAVSAEPALTLLAAAVALLTAAVLLVRLVKTGDRARVAFG
ncbi:hypothetical protein LO763_27355 [Glycomyces sp. A-F 0318]|uniref:tryptophan-rich sensory protein n=1 Tax=Glycomyces amatae TaxID=2881355 RepID=UPI001E2DC39D|nr:tryptophan-rich sensory protein [Glycomyces amatae]MCD0447339.1 hypothetical protein [Glycomyces amatae]